MSSFASAGAILSDEWTTVYEAPDATVAIVLLAQVAATEGVGATVDVRWVSSEESFHLVSGARVPEGSASGVVDGRLVLPANAAIEARVSDGDAEMTVSVLEES